jgi:hypothetical protein
VIERLNSRKVLNCAERFLGRGGDGLTTLGTHCDAESAEADQHHGPGGRFGNRRGRADEIHGQALVGGKSARIVREEIALEAGASGVGSDVDGVAECRVTGACAAFDVERNPAEVRRHQVVGAGVGGKAADRECGADAYRAGALVTAAGDLGDHAGHVVVGDGAGEDIENGRSAGDAADVEVLDHRGGRGRRSEDQKAGDGGEAKDGSAKRAFIELQGTSSLV